MWLVDWLRDILPSCLKGGEKKTIITKLTDENNVNIAGNSTQDDIGVVATKRKQSVEKAFGADNLKRRKIVSNQGDKINTNNVNIQDDINELNVSMIQTNNNEDSFKEPDDEKESSFFKWIMQTNNKEEQNTNCNNDGNIQFTLNNVSLNDTANLNR